MSETIQAHIRIAIADDHEILRKGVTQLLTKYGFDVMLEANNGREMIEMLEKSPVLPDICILDINMPEMNGYATLEEIRKRWPRMKILALSMYDNEFGVIRMYKSGANGYMLKDSNPKELQQALLSIYEDGYYHSDLISSEAYKNLKGTKNPNFPKITDKEMEFLALCATDMTYKEMAEKMFLSPRTVERYGEILYEKLNVRSRSGLVLFALSMGIVPKH